MRLLARAAADEEDKEDNAEEDVEEEEKVMAPSSTRPLPFRGPDPGPANAVLEAILLLVSPVRPGVASECTDVYCSVLYMSIAYSKIPSLLLEFNFFLTAKVTSHTYMQMANIFMCDVDRAHVMMMMCTVAVLYVSMSEFLYRGGGRVLPLLYIMFWPPDSHVPYPYY